MNHVCKTCGKVRDCGCGDCGENRLETCATCQNLKVIPFAEKYNIPLLELGLNPLGGYFIKEEHLERWKEYLVSLK